MSTSYQIQDPEKLLFNISGNWFQFLGPMERIGHMGQFLPLAL